MFPTKKAVLFLVAVLAAALSFAPAVASAAEIAVGPGESIQVAVNAAASGDTIRVAGVHAEQVIVTGKTLTIVGQAGAVIQPPATPLVTNTSTSSGPLKAMVYLRDSNVVLKGLTIDGAGKGNANRRFVGVLFENASGALLDSTVKDIRDTPFSGSQHGVAVMVLNPGAAPQSVQIRDNAIYGYQKNGMAISGASITAQVEGNRVTGAGPTGVTAQNGIQIGGGATGQVKRNVVTGHVYTGPSWTAAGILSQGASKVMFQGNTVVDGQTGFYLYGTSESSIVNNDIVRNGAPGVEFIGALDYAGSGNKITNNSFTGVEYGVWIYESTGAKVISNRFKGALEAVIDDGTATKRHADHITP